MVNIVKIEEVTVTTLHKRIKELEKRLRDLELKSVVDAVAKKSLYIERERGNYAVSIYRAT